MNTTHTALIVVGVIALVVTKHAPPALLVMVPLVIAAWAVAVWIYVSDERQRISAARLAPSDDKEVAQ